MIGLRMIAWVYILATGFVYVFGAALPFPFARDGRFIGLLGDPGASAGMSAMLLPFVFSDDFQKRKSLFLIPLVVLYLFFPFRAFTSRAGVLALGLGFTVLFLARKGSWKKTLGMLGIIVCIGWFIFWTGTARANDAVVENRAVLLREGLGAVMEQPVFGYGPESIEWVYKERFDRMGINLQGLSIDSSHMVLLDVLLWSGLVGFAAFALWVFVAFGTVLRSGNATVMSMVVPFAVYSLFQPVWLIHWVVVCYAVASAGKDTDAHHTEKAL